MVKLNCRIRSLMAGRVGILPFCSLRRDYVTAFVLGSLRALNRLSSSDNYELSQLTWSSSPTMSARASSSSAPVAHNALPPPSNTSAQRSSRIAPHSHIKGLGLSAEGYANVDTAGFIGQRNAREVCAAYVESIPRLRSGICTGMWRRG